MPQDTAARGLFGQLALSKGYITREQLLEALDEQTRARARGESIELGQILIRNNWLTTDQFVEILRLQNRALLRCPKCGRGFNCLGVAGGKVIKCIACGTDLMVPSTVHDLQASVHDQLAVTVESADPVAPPKLKIGRYELVREIARGGMAIVFEARDPSLNRRIALKVIKETPRTRDLVKRLYREAEIAASLRHPNIVNIFEVGTDANTHYIAMEYVDGPTLQQLLADARLEPREAARIVADVAAAVQHAHARGVIHRDIKPANVLIDPSRRVVVTDFGLARADSQGVKITQAGSPLGTPHYMSPEQVRGQLSEIDAQSDVFSLGVVLYEMLAGRRPFEGGSAIEVYAKITREATPPPAVDGPLGRICARALEKDKAKRYPSAQALADDLRAFLDGTLRAPPPPAPAPPPEASPERRLAIRAAGVVVLALVLIGAVAIVRGNLRRSARVEELRTRIELAEKQARYEDAARDCEELATVDASLAAASVLRAFHFRQAAERQKAARLCDEALARARAAAEQYRVSDAEGRPDEACLQDAVREYLTALRHDPASLGARTGLADLAWQRLAAAEREGLDTSMWRLLVEQYHDGRYAEDLKGDGTIEVTTEPPGARVTLDDRDLRGLATVPMGRHTVTARATGFRDTTAIAHVARRQSVVLALRLYTDARIGADFVHVPAGDFPMGERAQPTPAGDFFISRKPLSARSWEEANTYAETLTGEARARGERVSYRLPTEIEWEKAARGADVYGLADLRAEWCVDLFDAPAGLHALRGFGARLTDRKGGSASDTAAFRLVRCLEE